VKRPLTLAGILALPRYRRLFASPRIKTIWLTAYPVFEGPSGPDEMDLRRIVPEEDWRRERIQMAQMVEWLYRTYGSRDQVVLISNHEADVMVREILRATGDIELAIGNVTRDLEERFEGVDAARRKFPGARLKVLFGAEISMWRLTLEEGLNALESVLPQLAFDFVSFSAWETITQPETLPEALADIARRTRSNVTPEGRAFFGERHVVVGEFGFAREWNLPPAVAAAALAEACKARYAVYWQLYDNVEGQVRRFGLLHPNGRLTQAGRWLLQPPRHRGTEKAPK
jgi:hypothetical protein